MYPLPPLTHTSYVLPATGRRLQSNLPKGGLSLQRLIQPRADMAMREQEADQQIELIGSCTKTALSGPDLSNHFPVLFIDLLTHSSPGTRYTAHCARAIVAAGGGGSHLVSSPWPKDHLPFYSLMQWRRACGVCAPACLSTSCCAAFQIAQQLEERPFTA